MFPHKTDDTNSRLEYSARDICNYEWVDILAQENEFHQTDLVAQKRERKKEQSIKREGTKTLQREGYVGFNCSVHQSG